MVAICPCCGFDLTKDEPIERAGIAMAPYGNVRFHGAVIDLTPSETAVLWALLKSDRPLSRTVLAERIGYDGDHADRLLDVHLYRLRRKLAPHGPVPIRSHRGVGISID